MDEHGRRMVTTNLEAKLDELLSFCRKLEAAFAPAPPLIPSPDEQRAMEEEIAKLMGEAPSDEDLIMWSTPGPLPSEIAAAEAEPEDA